MKKHFLSIALLFVGSLALGLAYPHLHAHEVHPTHIDPTKLRGTGDIPSHGPGQYAWTKVTSARGSRRNLALGTRDPSASTVVPGFYSSAISPASPDVGFHESGRGRSGDGDAGTEASLRASLLPANRYQGESTLLMRDSGIGCGAPFCSAASHTMANPFRYPFWTVAKGRSLFGNIGMTRPLRLCTVPLAFSKGIKAAVLPANRYQAEDSHSKGDGDGSDCGAPFCSAASHMMVNPLRYPVWMLAKACSLFGSIRARAMSPTDGLPTHNTGLAPPHDIDRHDDIDDHNHEKANLPAKTTASPNLPQGLPSHETKINKRVGGYAPMNRGPSNSSAPQNHLIPFARLSRSALFPIKGLGMPVSSTSLVPQTDALGLEEECEDVDVNRSKNAHESLGLGSALMRMWARMTDW